MPSLPPYVEQAAAEYNRDRYAQVLRETTSDLYAEFRAKYRDKPVQFALDCFNWPKDETLSDYQAEALEGLYEHGRFAERAPRGGGKSATAAILIHHFALTNDIDYDWKIPVTAGSWNQLIFFLFPEVHKWAGRVKWEVVGREPYNRSRELLERTIKLKTGEAFAIATDRPELIEGAHASKLLLVFDEAKSIPDAIWDAAEGSLSSGDTFAFAISTPGETNGRFWEIHTGKVKSWKTLHVTKERAIAAGRMTEKWVAEMRDLWEKNRPDLWATQVEAMFYTTAPDQLIPAHWIDMAIERYAALERAGELEKLRDVDPSTGVDVAEFGGDRTVITKLFGMVYHKQEVYEKLDVMQVTGHVVGAMGPVKENPVAIDANGVGAGVWARMRELGYEKSIRVMVGESTKLTDRHKTNAFVNVRAALYWFVREAFDPENDPEQLIAMPDVPDLVAELGTPKWARRSNGAIEIEHKDKIKERLKGRSPDLFESLALAIWARRAKFSRGWNIV